jgi:hypothetical protein
MTKAELIEALMPFDDEIEIGVQSVNPGYWHSIADARYGMDVDNTGLLILYPNAPQIVLKRAAQRRGTE